VLAQISLVTRRPRGGVSLKPSSVTADTLRFGRGAGSEVLMPDIRVGIAEAVLSLRDGTLYLNQVGTNPITVNGVTNAAAVVKSGDEILIGPYRIEIVDPPEGVEVALTVELVSPLGDDFARLQAQNVLALDQTWLSKRRTAWGFAVVVAALFLVLPVLAYLFNGVPDPRAPERTSRVIPQVIDQSWNVGEISNTHKNFGGDCRSCHQNAFIQVRDSACLTCHAAVQHHVDTARFPKLEIDRTSCIGCHQEHRGAKGVVIQAQSLCVDCHGDLKRTASNAELRDVGDFGRSHPQFRVTVVADAAAKTFARPDVEAQPAPVDHSNMKFGHKGHLDATSWPKEMRKLACADCHRPDRGGGLYMQPISFARDCAECHESALKFEATALDRAVPHGNAMLAQRAIQDFYARRALEGGVTEPDAPAVVRRRPGAPPLSEPERLEALAWAKQRAEAARNFVFDDKRGCGTCHTIDRSGPEFTVAPVLLLSQFLPKSRFNHAKHVSVACDGCHAARQSQVSADVLIPGIENCRACHGGESASAKVQSTCISCHDFHTPGIGPMRPASGAGQAAKTD
jgi:predicted CXXCH cytochrome family protein